jgi:glycosyltransferase involved in cell wall biosynthesis
MFLAAAIARRLGIPHVHTFHSNYAGTHTTTPFLSGFNSLTYMLIAPIIMKRIRSDLKLEKVRYPRHLVNSEKSRLAKLDWRSVCRLAQYTDAFTSPAEYVVQSIVDASKGKLAHKGFAVANGVNPVFARTVRNRPYDDGIVRFLSSGRLDPEKRVDQIVKAFGKLDKSNTELFIMGHGSDKAKLKRLADKHVKKGEVVFLGQYDDHERVANEFANADAFVFASFRFDTQGMVLAEAASAGTPIVYVDDRLKIGVTPDNALLVRPSVTGLHFGMRTLYEDANRRRTMSKAGLKLRPQLTPQHMEEKFVAVYRYGLEHHR